MIKDKQNLTKRVTLKSLTILKEHICVVLRRGGQVVRRRSRKPKIMGSIPIHTFGEFHLMNCESYVVVIYKYLYIVDWTF